MQAVYILRAFGGVLILSAGSGGSNPGVTLATPLAFRDGIITLLFR